MLKTDPQELSSLRKSIRTYNVCFTVTLGEVEIRKREVDASFLVELRGYHHGFGECDSIPCRRCIRVLWTLLAVAEAIGPFKYRDDPVRPGYEFEKRLRFSAEKGEQREVVLGLEIQVRQPFATATDGWALNVMEVITTQLLALKCENKEGKLGFHPELAAAGQLSGTREGATTGEGIDTDSRLSA